MKKAIVLFALVCAFVLTLSACGAKTRNDDTRQDSFTSATTGDVTLSTEQSFSEDVSFVIGGDSVLNENYKVKWLEITSHCLSVLQEREWVESYEKKYGISFDELMAKRFEWGMTQGEKSQELTTLEELVLKTQDKEQVFYDAVSREDWYHSAWFLDALAYFSVNEEEFVRQNNREKAALARCEAAYPDTDWQDSFYIFTDEEIALLFSGDVSRINAKAANEWTIIVGDRVYSAHWVVISSIEDYAKAGITPEMLAEKAELYAEFEFTAEAADAFEAKLSEFTGRTVSLRER